MGLAYKRRRQTTQRSSRFLTRAFFLNDSRCCVFFVSNCECSSTQDLEHQQSSYRSLFIHSSFVWLVHTIVRAHSPWTILSLLLVLNLLPNSLLTIRFSPSRVTSAVAIWVPPAITRAIRRRVPFSTGTGDYLLLQMIVASYIHRKQSRRI